jgi:hypothetical protein
MINFFKYKINGAKMAKKSKNLSLEEEVIEYGKELVKAKLHIKDFSQLVESYILEDIKKLRKSRGK